jgi:hypothetical protein
LRRKSAQVNIIESCDIDDTAGATTALRTSVSSVASVEAGTACTADSASATVSAWRKDDTGSVTLQIPKIHIAL